MKFKLIQIVLIVAALGGVCIFAPIVSAETAVQWNNKGVDYIELGEYENAIECFDKAIELDPNSAGAYYNRGDAYNNLKEYERAIEDYNKAIELDPNSAGAYNNRGVAYNNLKEYERAIEDYNKAIELNPNSAEAYYNREIARSKLEEQQAQTPTPTPTPTPPQEPFFHSIIIIFLVFSLAIGLPLIFIIYRKGKPPSGGSNQQKPSEPEDYTQKIDEYKEKMEEWEKEGYDVSELKEVLEGKK